jgi:pseudouridine kinase
VADRILVIGGSNIDYLARSNKPLVKNDSNPGVFTAAFGGVGRNVVENLARLGDQVTFITGVGNDSFGKMLVAELVKLNVNIHYPEPTTASSSYIAICNDDGDMEVAVCDSRAIDNLSIKFIKEFDAEIRARDFLSMEANLSAKLIADLFHTYPDKKWCVEAVSANKVVRVKRFLPKIFLFKGNLIEAQTLLGLKENAEAEECAKGLLAKGVKNVIITQGSGPICYGGNSGIHFYRVKPLPKEEIVNATGAGDAMFAGIIHMLNQGEDWETCINFGQRLAALSLKSDRAVSFEVSNLFNE